MASRGWHCSGSVPVALAALMALVCVAGVAAVTGWLALAPRQPAVATSFHSVPPCRICGVVEGVRELDAAKAKPMPLNGDRDESIVIMLAALAGKTTAALSAAVPTTYETWVRFEDGSVRILRDSRTPQWKAGDRVKVMRGRVEPLS